MHDLTTLKHSSKTYHDQKELVELKPHKHVDLIIKLATLKCQ